ncbi:MAG: redox-regulated ATPase YchF, partial [Candidatus Sungbacteria bacterium]|nr:redox-regulated ATPase YchF [Candidatus Sungbacteria bacterium]
MSLSIGIVGLPNVGKSTLFQALTKKEVLIANYPFATIDPNVGVVAVPDERVEKLAVFSRSEKKVPAVVEFVDIAGLVRGANKGEGLGNQFLAHIREVDAVIYMIRAFEDPSILHVEARVDPKDDIEILTTELMLKDLETVEKHWEKLIRDAKGGNKDAARQLPILEKVRDGLRDGVMAYKTFLSQESPTEREVCEKLKRDLQLLTSKRGIFVLNINERGLAPAGASPQFQKFLNSFSFPSIILSAREELDSAEFGDEERKEVGLGPAKLPELIRLAYETLGLIT